MADFAFIPPLLRSLVQENHLTQDIKAPLVPHNLFRDGITREKWAAKAGDVQVMNRQGTMRPVVRASRPRVDPQTQTPTFEQWKIECQVIDGSIEVDIRQDFHTVVDEFRRRMGALGLQAGTSVARWFRAKAHQAYLGGHTWLTATGSNGNTTIQVQSIAGFTHMFNALNRYELVSASNPLVIVVGSESCQVIGATPLDSDKPHGPGILLLSAALAAGPHAANTPVLSALRPKVLRVGGGLTSRAITSGDVLKLSHIDSMVARLKSLGVPAFSDGNYRCHLSAESARQLRDDEAWQRQVRGVPDHERVTQFEVGRISNVVFIENEESPRYLNVLPEEDIAGAVMAADSSYVWNGTTYVVPGTGDQNICRVLLTGPDSMVEHYVPEMEFEQVPGSAGFGRREMLGDWVVEGGYLKGLVNGVYVYFRLPQDAKGERSTVTWSWTGDAGVPTDRQAQVTDPAAYKRSIICEHADLG